MTAASRRSTARTVRRRASARSAARAAAEVPRLYTVAEARAALASLRPVLSELISVRADAAELTAAVQRGSSSPLGGLPELKGAQARFDELLSLVVGTEDVQVKGIAPVLLDFPAQLDGTDVLLCWLEGDAELSWYHRVDLGFLGRRPLD